MKTFFAGGVLAALICSMVSATPLEGDKTYDMLFRNGTLDDVSTQSELVYARSVTNALKPEAEARDSGLIALGLREGETATLAVLELRQEGKYRKLGAFPASVGNPMIMYFYETVVRDMAEVAGGSPFYIRNRVKESLVQTSDIVEGEAMVNGRSVPTRTIRLYPFKDDPNRDRMQGFGDLELRVTMSDAVPGWYMSLVAEASGGEVYRSELMFDGLSEAK